MSHFPTTVFFFCFIITKTKAPKSKDTKQNKNNHTCTIESKSAPSENIRSAETTVLKHRASSQVWPDYRFFSHSSISNFKQNKYQRTKQANTTSKPK